MMGIEHERIHLETSSVLIRQLPASMVAKPPKWKYAPAIFGNERSSAWCFTTKELYENVSLVRRKLSSEEIQIYEF